MALPSTGAISMSQVNTELGKGATAHISLGDSAVRTLAGKSSGAISMGDLRGKSNEHKCRFTIANRGANYGFSAGLYGALTNATIAGATITSLYSIAGTGNLLTVYLSGTIPNILELDFRSGPVGLYYMTGWSDGGDGEYVSRVNFSSDMSRYNGQTVDLYLRVM